VQALTEEPADRAAASWVVAVPTDASRRRRTGDSSHVG
jgi:hypothetical protein